MSKKVFLGYVVANVSDKTVKVLVKRSAMHKKYKKIVMFDKRYMVHDEDNAFAVGDYVKIIESKPISKRKRWVVLDKVR